MLGPILCYPIFNSADTLLEDAERIKNEQTKRIETLEADLNIASNRGGVSAKNEPLIGAVETVQPASVVESKQTIVCQSFSDDNKYVTVSNDKRSVKHNAGSGYVWGYCFLNHEKIKKDQILKWSLRVPKFKYSGFLGIVTIPK